MRKFPTLLCAATAALLAGALGVVPKAQIKMFTLDEMVDTADGAIHGQIIDRQVFRVDDPLDGPELYFTRLTIEGQSLAAATPMTVQVTYHGGFIDDTQGVYNSEAPAADDVQVGKRVVAFYQWTDDMGGGVAANSLVAAHGGLYRTVEGPSGAAVMGRGEGYAIAANARIATVQSAVRELYVAKKARSNK
jgi:hypothetical protein